MAETGLWDEAAQLWFVLPATDAFETLSGSFLVVARPGVDGIEFGYRRDHIGIWAYYPIDAAFEYLANTIDELVTRWYAGDITA